MTDLAMGTPVAVNEYECRVSPYGWKDSLQPTAASRTDMNNNMVFFITNSIIQSTR